MSLTKVSYSMINGATFNVLDYGAKGDGFTDDTIAIQNAVNAASGNVVYFPAGRYKISSAINVLSRVSLIGAGKNQVTLVLATQNQNGIVVGDGTLDTRNACGNVAIANIDFNIYPGVSAFSSGSCILLDYVFGAKVEWCSIYGKDGSTTKLFNGVTVNSGQEFFVNYCSFTGLLGVGISVAGAVTAGKGSSDGRLDYCEFINITGDCVHFYDYTEGMTLNFPIAYQYSAAAVHIDTSKYNFFINQPDFEIDGTSSGIYVAQGSNVQIVGGWIGGNGTVGGLYVNTGASGVNVSNCIFSQSLVSINGPQCQIVGCDIAGLGIATYNGIEASANAQHLLIVGNKIRQWGSFGISFDGAAVNSLVVGNTFTSNASDINGDAWSPQTGGAKIEANVTDFGYNQVATGSLILSPAKSLYQVTGATPITSINQMAAECRVVLQAGAGGISIHNGNDITLKGGTNVSVPAYSLIELISDGVGWSELSRNF